MNKKRMILLLSMLIFIGVVVFFTLDRNVAVSAPAFYVANAGDGTLSKIDLDERESVESISLGVNELSHGIAISPDEKVVYYGTGFQGKSLQALEVDTQEIVSELIFDEGVHGIDIHPSGEFLYVSLMGGLGEDGGVLAVVDTNTFTEIARITTDDGPAHVSVTNDGAQIWVANVNGNSISVVDAYTYQVLATIPVGEVPNEVAVSPTMDFAYSANVRSNTISVIDMVRFEVIEEIQVGEGVHGVTVSPDGKQVWTANNHSNDVSVIDVETLSVVKTIETASYANHISFSPNGEFAFVTHRESNNLVIIDTKDYSILNELDLGNEPHEMTLKGMLASNETMEDDFTDRQETKNYLVSGEEFTEGVDIQIQLLSPYNLENQELIWELANVNPFDFFFINIDMSTHSGDLMAVPFDEGIVLANEEGTEVSPIQWIVVNEESHHPRYMAIFEKTVNMTPLLTNQNSYLEMIFRPFINEEEVRVELSKH
ncbi:YncE family protein [Evansella cellulosilytica]|uniref:40-residue YVTN family beta-propeller repeat protein n=1 Tax=Evansella cellulosilytica (strain ATCC 21833 / DSM 2522 / FERM P-1141 / JCM 9156 / N-4) TaxID=649639 RepID=E6TYX8_EVAC2|nr:YncE family protein [Evansella cellulosilytica]ADU31313.1 40-residue YVTN family beta-propeller repeat protein [Evansella cellulosilytica DSM 2522]